MNGIMKPTSGYALPSFFTTFSSLIYSTFPEMGYHYKLQNGQEGWIWVQKTHKIRGQGWSFHEVKLNII